MIQTATVTDQRLGAAPVDDDELSPTERTELADLYVSAITGLLPSLSTDKLDELFRKLLDWEDEKEPPAKA